MADEGGCLCGAVRYRLMAAPSASLICHCRSCRKASGSAAVAWITVESRNFALLSGAGQSFQSSPGVTRSFCAICGTPLTYRNARDGGSLDIATATLDDPGRFPPTREIWLEHRLSWQCVDGARDLLPRESGSN